MSAPRVLLVEDEFLINDMVAQMLDERGFQVHSAFNGAEAFDYLAAHGVDILFTDINLPGDMDGIALAKRAREIQPDIAVVYASGRYCAIDQIGAVPDSLFVAKPYNILAVCAMLARAPHPHRSAHCD